MAKKNIISTDLCFPRIYRLLESLPENYPQTMRHVVFQKGKLIATNGHILLFHDASVFIEDAECCEGMILDIATCKALSVANCLSISADYTGIKCKIKKQGEQFYPYSGRIDDTRVLYSSENEPIGGEKALYPNWEAVYDLDNYTEESSTWGIGLSMLSLNLLSDCFLHDHLQGALMFRFSKTFPRKSAVLVTSERDGQRAILMPSSMED